MLVGDRSSVCLSAPLCLNTGAAKMDVGKIERVVQYMNGRQSTAVSGEPVSAQRRGVMVKVCYCALAPGCVRADVCLSVFLCFCIWRVFCPLAAVCVCVAVLVLCVTVVAVCVLVCVFMCVCLCVALPSPSGPGRTAAV